MQRYLIIGKNDLFPHVFLKIAFINHSQGSEYLSKCK